MAETGFIACKTELLPAQAGHELQSWLAKGEFNTLKRIVESRARKHLAEATNAAMQAAGDAPLKVNIADENLKKARQCVDFLELLQQIKDQKEPFEVNKWT